MMRLHPKSSLRLFAVLVLLALSSPRATTAQAAFIDLTPTNGANSSVSVPLGDLTSGEVDGITVGDKVFSEFMYSRIGDMPAAIDVMVLGFKDPDGNWGISFHGSFLDLPGGAPSDALIRFNVDIDPVSLQQGYRITDAHLAIGGAGTGGSNSLLLVDESFSNGEMLEAYVSTLGALMEQQLTDVVFFAPVTKLRVTKDILAIAAFGNFLPARATVIDQSFSQIVPEPATAFLSMIGFMGLALLKRTRS